MLTRIIHVKNPLLKPYIQYFLFFQSEKNETISYTTFPNINLCLSIYRNNSVDFKNEKLVNQIDVETSNSSIKSYFAGFHRKALSVKIENFMDEICVLFYPSALRAFTNVNFNELMNSNEAFQLAFNSSNYFILEKLFEEIELEKRTTILENFLLQQLVISNHSVKIKTILQFIHNQENINYGVQEIAKHFQISEATLYRLCINELGQSPKNYIKTVRFRKVLNDILIHQNELTKIAYTHNFFDQAHLIKDFKQISGITPKQTNHKISVLDNELIWIYEEK
ncbi:helix-turn-helix domain-containing protein [Empedobacter brevis]|uniref:helix-turn-helix transcriptional regulator n=1 Tax=Empedobacter brevis TaxID=247 RepID=UPI0023F0294C|nr:helix-turn-helix transcriptional regulator [Empedobacter brevis]